MKNIQLLKYGIILIAFVSCKREAPTSWNTEVLAPLAKGRITLGNIVPDSFMQADENSLWHLMISENLTDFNLDDIAAIPDTTIAKKFTVPIVGGPFALPNGTSIINQHDNNLMRVNDAELRFVRIKSGKLEYSLKSYINGYLSCTYDIPGLKLNGVGTLIQTNTEPKQGNQPFISTGEIDLAGYEMDLTGQSGFMSNRIYTHLSILTSADAPEVAQVYGQDSVVVELRFVEPKIEYARGYFGQHIYNLNQTVDFGDGFNMPSGALNIDQASMNLDITNAVGVDAQIQFESISGYNVYTDNTVQLAHPPLYQSLNITRAADNGGNIQSHSYGYSLNNGNSNIDAFIENLPASLQLQGNVKINPLGNITDGNDFIYTDNTLKAILNLDIPLSIGMENVAFADTMSITTSSSINADGNLVLYVNNAFPFSAKCSVSIIDEFNQTVNSLLTDGLIDYAISTSTPGLTVPVLSTLSIPLNPEILSNLDEHHRIVIGVKLNTPTFNDHYGLYKNYFMDFKIIADGKLEVSYE